MKFRSISSLFFLSGLAGVLSGFGHRPEASWLGFFGLVPLIRIWCFDSNDTHFSKKDVARRLLRGALSGWIAQTIQFLIAAHWFWHGIREFGITNPFLSFGVFLVIAATNTLALPVAGGLIQAFAPAIKGRARRSFVAAAILILCELWIPSFIPAPLGHIAFLSDIEWRWGEFSSSTMPMIQLADLVGLGGLSFIVALFGSLLAMGNRKGMYGAFALLLGANLLGARHGRHWLLTPKRGEVVQVLLLQPFTSNDEKRRIDSPIVAHAMVDRQILMTKRALARGKITPDLVVWPETAVPDALDGVYAGGVLPRRLRNFVHESGVPLMTGAFSRNPKTHREANAVFVIDERAGPSRPYLKTRLFPFAESLPFAKWLPRIREWFPQLSEYSDAAGEPVLRVGKLRAGLSICYEILFDDFARTAVRSDANALLNLSNEAWFESELASRQFIAFARARAIEARLPLIRVSNYANTLVLTAGGRVGPSIPRVGVGAIEAEVYVESHLRPTVFMAIAKPGLTLALMVLLGVIGMWVGSFRLENSRGALKSAIERESEISWASESC